MYARGTILTIKDEDSLPATASAYYRVEVVGQSPIQHAQDVNGVRYSGGDAVGVIIKPAGEEFDSTIDEPYGKLRDLYDVDTVPEFVPNVLNPQQAPAKPSPEDVFKAAREDKPAKAPKRTRRTPDARTPEDQIAGTPATPTEGVKPA